MNPVLKALGNGTGTVILKWLGAAAFAGMLYAQLQGLRDQMNAQVHGMSVLAQEAVELKLAIRDVSTSLAVRVEAADKEHAQMYRRIEKLEDAPPPTLRKDMDDR